MQAARPSEEGGKRRIAPAKCEGANGPFWERTYYVASTGAEGSALDKPYVNNPGYWGHLLWNPDDLLTLTNFAVRRGWKIGIHAIGKPAVRTLLDVYEQGIKENPGLKPGTLVFEHGFLADAGKRVRAMRLGIPVTIQHPLLYTLG